MASSNRHWPSMFKSKPAHHQWQHDMNSSLLSSTGGHRTPYAPGCEERTPEPKPRWNPRPEQIRILEAIFNSGMVNPPRDEIKKIRAQLQEYGQVGDANVFYWFQNRKSRSKHKQRQLLHQTAVKSSQPQQNTTTNSPSPPPPTVTATAATTQTQPANKATFVAAPSFSSSSSDQSSFHSTSNIKEKTTQLLSVGSTTVMDLLNSPTASVNQQQPFFQGTASADQFLNEPFFLPHVQQKNNEGSPATAASLTQGFCFPDVVSTVADDHRAVGSCSNFLFSELMLMNSFTSKKVVDEEDENMKLEQQLSHYGVTTATVPSCVDTPILSVPSPISHILHGETNPGPTDKSTVFINDVCFEVGFGPFNVREAFGYDAMLIQSTGQPVLTNEWGVTLQPLQNGAFYYLVRTPFAPNSSNIFANDRTIDLI